MKRIIKASMVLLTGLTCLTGCGGNAPQAADGEGVRIYVSLSQADTFRTTLGILPFISQQRDRERGR